MRDKKIRPIVSFLMKSRGLDERADEDTGDDSGGQDADSLSDDDEQQHGPDPDLLAVAEDLLDGVRRGSPKVIAEALEAACAVCARANRYSGGR